MGPDWPVLPPELIELISKKNPFTNTYVRFRAVCPSWRLATSPCHISPLPWLMLPLDSLRSPTPTTLSFYDSSDSKTHQFDLPCILGKSIIVSNQSWLVLHGDMDVSLVNPITGEVKSNLIPSLGVPPTILGFARNERTRNPQGFDKRCTIQKVVLTSSPCDENCFVVAEFNWESEYELGFCRVGDSQWTILKLREYNRGCTCMLDFTCKNNLVYAINNIGRVIVYNLCDLSQNIMNANPIYHTFCNRLHLVLGVEGELNGVPLAVKEVYYSLMRGHIEVYKMCTNTNGKLKRKHRWTRINNIGNAVLVLDKDHRCKIFSLDNSRLNNVWEKNHVWFCNKRSNYNLYYSTSMRSIDNGHVEEVDASLGDFSVTSIGVPYWFSPWLY